MTKTTRIAAAIAAAALASAALYAQQLDWLAQSETPAPPPASPDIAPLPVANAVGRVETVPNLPNDFGVTHEQVGDADSFGRPLKWLGIHFLQIAFQPTCPRANAVPGELCQPIPNLNSAISFTQRSSTSIELPAYAATSLICQWISPYQSVTFSNTTSTRRYGIFRTTPVVTIYSEALGDPNSTTTIAPTTPWSNGKWVMTLGSHYNNMTRPLEPGVLYNETSRNSQVCMSGILSRRALIEGYGMSEAMADDFFSKPMRLEFGVTGVIQNVQSAYLTMGTRLVGD